MTNDKIELLNWSEYEDIIKQLESNHFYPITEIGHSKKGKTIIGLQVECPPILVESKKKRLDEILAGCKVKITWMPNEGFLVIKKIK